MPGLAVIWLPVLHLLDSVGRCWSPSADTKDISQPDRNRIPQGNPYRTRHGVFNKSTVQQQRCLQGSSLVDLQLVVALVWPLLHCFWVSKSPAIAERPPSPAELSPAFKATSSVPTAPCGAHDSCRAASCQGTSPSSHSTAKNANREPTVHLKYSHHVLVFTLLSFFWHILANHNSAC